ncbi:hypothetical protein [Paenibacillus sp. BAC0078]
MSKKTVESKLLTRQQLANPHPIDSLNSRLTKSGAIDLRNNSYFKDLGNGYGKRVPKDRNKLWREN